MGKPGDRHGSSSARRGTRGTETSKYPEEEKSNEMPTVAASEEGRAQTGELRLTGVEDPRKYREAYPNVLESTAEAGESPVG